MRTSRAFYINGGEGNRENDTESNDFCCGTYAGDRIMLNDKGGEIIKGRY